MVKLKDDIQRHDEIKMWFIKHCEVVLWYLNAWWNKSTSSICKFKC